MSSNDNARLERDYVLIIDKSGSMEEPSGVGTLTRWQAAEESTIALARFIEKKDPDGIDLYFFAGAFNRYEGVKAADVKSRYAENSPNGSTDLASVLKDAFSRWETKGKKPTTIAVVTDGEPTDRAAVAKAIVDVTNKMSSDNQLALLFVQMGDDAKATGFLTELDDGLSKYGAKYDVVDTKKWSDIEKSGKSFKDVLLEAVTG